MGTPGPRAAQAHFSPGEGDGTEPLWPAGAASARLRLNARFPRCARSPERTISPAMLQWLRIRNLALLEAVELEFGPGFTAVTGETGAGKSILLGALGLLAGNRADKATLVRQGADACEVEAALHFADTSALDARLARLALPPCEEGTLLLKRTIPRDKAPRIVINGSFATLAALAEIGETWIDFHGPGEPRRLLKPSCQLDLLDLFAAAGTELSAYRTHYDDWLRLESELATLRGETQLSAEQIDFLRHQIDRIEALELSPEGVEELERRFARMSRAQELQSVLLGLAQGLTGDDGVLGRVAALVREAAELQRLDPASKPLADRLASLAVEVEDLGGEFESLGQECSFDEEEVATMTERMNAWLDLRRRHGGSVDAVLAALAEMRHKLAAQGDLAGTVQRLERERDAAHQRALAAARTLRAKREKAARELARAGARRIAELGFKKSELAVRLTTEPRLGPHGDCACEFLFSPNVGVPPLPLHRIASSGELARVMLALKTVLADLDAIPLLVFDEVDANVGGEVGRTVGARLADLAGRHQVLCVTHLPQVAAQAAHHLVVEKDQSGDRASVSISALQGDRAARVAELARMLGDRSSKSHRRLAEEMLTAE
jgi:DNA repair protein RecN (Recombination protein N)